MPNKWNNLKLRLTVILGLAGFITNKPQGNTVVNSQSNYNQINNTILSQENLKCLSAKQLNQIETVVAIILP